MKCRNLKILCGMFFLAFCSLFGLSSQVYAVEDVSQTFRKDQVPGFFFNSLSAQERSQYKYLVIECVPDEGSDCLFGNYNNSYYSFIFTQYYYDSNLNNTVYCGSVSIIPYSDKIVVPLCTFDKYVTGHSPYPRFQLGRNNLGQNHNNFSIKLTLTNYIPFEQDCPVCEECKECPAIPENPYDDKLDSIVQAIYVCAATLLVIYFFYCIYRVIIKNSGVH